MKVFGRIVAVLIAGIIAVLTVQQVIRRAYKNFGKKYITLSSGEKDDSGELK